MPRSSYPAAHQAFPALSRTRRFHQFRVSDRARLIHVRAGSWAGQFTDGDRWRSWCDRPNKHLKQISQFVFVPNWVLGRSHPMFRRTYPMLMMFSQEGCEDPCKLNTRYVQPSLARRSELLAVNLTGIASLFFQRNMSSHTHTRTHTPTRTHARSSFLILAGSLWRQEEVPIKIKISSFNGLLNWQLNNDFRIGICQRSRKILSW